MLQRNIVKKSLMLLLLSLLASCRTEKRQCISIRDYDRLMRLYETVMDKRDQKKSVYDCSLEENSKFSEMFRGVDITCSRATSSGLVLEISEAIDSPEVYLDGENVCIIYKDGLEVLGSSDYYQIFIFISKESFGSAEIKYYEISRYVYVAVRYFYS